MIEATRPTQRHRDGPTTDRRPAAATRALVLGLVALLLVAACGAQQKPRPDLTGKWHGDVQTPGTPLMITARFDGDGGTLDLPAQGVTALPLTDLRVADRSVTFTVPDIPGGAAFAGTVDGETITGDVTQSGRADPFTLIRGAPPAPARPQEPRPPFPYRAEDVTYPSGGLTLAATLTRPETGGPFAASS